MKMTSAEFWEITPREFFNKLEGWKSMQEIKEQNEWDRCRWSTAYLLSPHSKKGRSIKPTDLIKLPWDEERRKKENKKIPTREEVLKMIKQTGL